MIPKEKDSAENKIYPRLMFAAPKSGSGKTLITCGFLELLKKRGMGPVSFKCGPDYIDPIFHSFVTGKTGTNLDLFFLDREKVTALFERKMDECAGDAATAVIEGVMGYYDGVAGTSLTASSYDVADCLHCPVILIIDVKKEGCEAEKELKGILNRVPDSHIRGVILNRADEKDAERLRSKIESLGLYFYGYVPECDEAKIESRHLGLTLPSEGERFQEKISAFADIMEETTDIGAIIKLANEASPLPVLLEHYIKPAVSKGRIAVARDKAFCFIYDDNLDFLRELGYETVCFSPLHDKALPQDVSAILLCGGYPEEYAAELSANKGMLRAISEAFGKTKIIAECGGFLYLHESLEGTDGKIYPMAGCIKAKAFRTDHSRRFGYISLYPKENEETGSVTRNKVPDNQEHDCLIRAHEFHYWESTEPGDDLYAKKPLTERGWDCCYVTPYLLAGFPHLYYRSGPGFIRSFLEEGKRC